MINQRCSKETKTALGLFIGLLLIMPLNSYIGLIFLEPPRLLQSLASTLTWSYGPLMLLLVNMVIRKQQHAAVLTLHFVPCIAFACLHYLSLSWLNYYIYHGILLLQTAVYLAISVYTLYLYRQKISTLGREFRNSTYYWMLYLIAGLFSISIFDNALVFLLYQGVGISFYFVSFTVSAFSIYISTIALFLLLQPTLFEREPEQEESSTAIPSIDENARNVELSQAAANELKKQLSELVALEKPHLDSEINLSKLATLLDISNHQLSELLNIHLETSFYDFLNRHRYNEAITLMESKPKIHSITDIAYLSGFNNRNSFYRVFKENTGLTPGEYRKKHYPK